MLCYCHYRWIKILINGDDVTFCGRVLHGRETATNKARSPMIERRARRTTSDDKEADDVGLSRINWTAFLISHIKRVVKLQRNNVLPKMSIRAVISVVKFHECFWPDIFHEMSHKGSWNIHLKIHEYFLTFQSEIAWNQREIVVHLLKNCTYVPKIFPSSNSEPIRWKNRKKNKKIRKLMLNSLIDIQVCPNIVWSMTNVQ